MKTHPNPLSFVQFTTLCLACFLLASVAMAAPPYRYVWPASPSPAAPYSDWSSAAHHITNALDGAPSGVIVLVTNGIYLVSTNMHIPDNVTVKSVNGSTATKIQAANYFNYFTCVTMGSGSTLDGFTVTNGYNFDGAGGVYCSGGKILNCSIEDNYSQGLGTYGVGGVIMTSSATMRNCLVSANVSDNLLSMAAGVEATDDCTIDACTIVDNYTDIPGEDGIGLYFFGNPNTLRNSIVYDNDQNWSDDSMGHVYEYSCSDTDFNGGTGCVGNDPQFQSGYLPQNTAVIDEGNNQPWMSTANDMGGYPRILGTTVDMGAFESATNEILHITSSTTDPKLSLELNYGAVTVGQTRTLPVIVRNLGHGMLSGRVTYVDAPFTLGMVSNYYLAYLESTNVYLKFTPPTTNLYTNSVFFSGSGTNVLLSGTGVPVPEPAAVLIALAGCLLISRRK